MSYKGLKWLLIVLLAMSVPASADIQFGAYGLQGQTNHDDLPNPAGVGGFIQKSLSPRTALRLSYSWAGNRDRYTATFYRWNPYSEADTLFDLWDENTSISIGEISFLAAPYLSEPVSLYLGFSVGRVRFHQDVAGRTLGSLEEPHTKTRNIVGLVADLQVSARAIRPFVFHLTLRERTTYGMSTRPMGEPLDSGSAYSGFSADFISNAEMSLALALKL